MTTRKVSGNRISAHKAVWSVSISALCVVLFLLVTAEQTEANGSPPRIQSVQQENLLVNGDFEQVSDGTIVGWKSVWPNFANPAPGFSVYEENVHGGKRCAAISTHHEGGYTSWTQIIENPPSDATLVRIEGWIRIEKEEEAEGENDSAGSLLIFFYDPDQPHTNLGFVETATIETPSQEWEKVEVEATIPTGAKNWIVRCGMRGRAKVFFDDVTLSYSTENGNWTAGVLAVAHGYYEVEAEATARKGWIKLSVPFPLGGQTPLGLRVTTEPAGSVAALSIAKERENRPLCVSFKRMKFKERIQLHVQTLVLLRDRPLFDGAGVTLADRSNLPKEVKLFLEPAPGVESNNKEILEIAASFERTDLKTLMDDLKAFLEENLTYDGGYNQGALSSIRKKKAVCTGHANAAAALLIAAGVPARILPCTLMSGKLQEHYIVEAWTPTLGWSRMESTAKLFPWGDTNNLILRIVYPDSPRSPSNVPLYCECGGKIQGWFGEDEAGSTCWQSAETLKRFLITLEDFESIEVKARQAFEKLTKKTVRSDSIRLIRSPQKMRSLGQRAQILLQEADRFFPD